MMSSFFDLFRVDTGSVSLWMCAGVASFAALASSGTCPVGVLPGMIDRCWPNGDSGEVDWVASDADSASSRSLL